MSRTHDDIASCNVSRQRELWMDLRVDSTSTPGANERSPPLVPSAQQQALRARADPGSIEHGILFDAVSKRYGDDTVLEDVSFVVTPGSSTALVGPNGAGKTTAIRLLLGLAQPSHGTVLLDGRPPSEAAPTARLVGAMTEVLGLDPDSTVRAFLRGMAGLIGRDSERADGVLEIVGAASFSKKRIGRLSLGMQQRVRIALAILPDAPYLVLDEPQNGLDPDGIDWLSEFLIAERQRGTTLVIATHHLHEVERLASECILLHRTVRYAGPIESSLSDIYRQFR